MIRFIPIDSIPPINLLTQYELHELMGERHLRERNRIVRSLHHIVRQTERSSDDEGDFTLSIRRELIKFTSELFARPLLSLDRQRDDVRIWGYLRQNPLAFLLFY